MTSPLTPSAIDDDPQHTLFPFTEPEETSRHIVPRARRKTDATFVQQYLLDLFEEHHEDDVDEEIWELDESQLYELHETLLHNSLVALSNDKANIDKLHDILTWALVDPDSEELFTFYTCCISGGYHPDEMRMHIKRILKKMPFYPRLDKHLFLDD